jgi:hypothetical protein
LSFGKTNGNRLLAAFHFAAHATLQLALLPFDRAFRIG